MAPVPKASLLERILIPIQLAFAISVGFLRFLTTPFRRGLRANTLFKDAAYATLRMHFDLLSNAQEQSLIHGTGPVYRKFMKTEKAEPETTTLKSGLKIHWFGGKSAKKTICFFHGGGYVLAASDGHLRWLYNVQKDMEQYGVNIMMVEYSLAPRAQYPTQLKQAAEALQWLLQDQNKSPEDVIVAGDSAGGNLALALLLHILHPHPDVPTKISLSQPLAGGILISPWISFGADHDSIDRNGSCDVISRTVGTRWSSNFMGSASRDNYNQPYFADVSFFEGLDKIAKDMLIWGGEREMIIDSIEELAAKMQKVHPRLEMVVEPGAGHEDFIMDLLLGYKQKAKGTTVVEDWLSSRL